MSKPKGRPKRNRAASRNRHHNDSLQPTARGFVFGLGAPTCPDCAARADGTGHLEHAYACPVSRSVDAALADDRAWFAEHPELDRRVRELTWGELQVARIFPGLFDAPRTGRPVRGTVTVLRTPVDGVRLRTDMRITWGQGGAS